MVKSPIQTKIWIENLILFVGSSRLINRGLLRYALLALGRGLLSEPAFLHRKWLIFDDIDTRQEVRFRPKFVWQILLFRGHLPTLAIASKSES
jgi:hypothetical protein